MVANNKKDARTAQSTQPLAVSELPRGSDQLFRILVQGVTDYAVFLLDTGGEITTWNAGAERITGFGEDEIIGSNFARFYTPEDRAAGLPQTALRTAAESGRFEHEGWRLRRDGSRFWAVALLDAICDENGRLIAFAKVIRDLSERLGAQLALRESEERFRMLVQGVTDYAIYMLDPEGYITNWNIGGERIKGYTERQAVGKHFSIFYTPEDRALGQPARTLATAAREGRFEGEGWRMRRDGTRFWASVVVDRILDKDGKLVAFAKVTRDMTEKKIAQEELDRARAALAQSQKMEAVGQLTGGVAHDFNNLLTVITNALDLLDDPAREGPQRHRIIDSAQRAAERGSKLTQQLLAFSRRQPLRPEVHNINRLISGFEAVLRRACPEPIEFVSNLSRDRLAANIDAQQFETALLNLVVNARDAMPKGGTLRLSTEPTHIEGAQARAMSDIAPGDYVTVSVADSGEGMPESVVLRAFEPFFTTKEVGKGSGLGLSQVYGFVTQSGGHVAIASRPGGGTTVTLYLPAVSAIPASQSETPSEAGIVPAVGRILIVEDDPEVLEVALEMLRRLGYEVFTAADGRAALSVLRREPDIDILFTDIVMPHGVNGVELAREALRLRPHLRVLLASGYPMSVLSEREAIGAENDFTFLAKPYRGAELAEALRSLQRA